jgi:HEAT repeat protein
VEDDDIRPEAIRESVVAALGVMGTQVRHPKVIPTLLDKLRLDRSFSVRSAAGTALGMIAEETRDTAVVPGLLYWLRDADEDSCRSETARYLGRMGAEAAKIPGVIEALLESLRDDS